MSMNASNLKNFNISSLTAPNIEWDKNDLKFGENKTPLLTQKRGQLTRMEHINVVRHITEQLDNFKKAEKVFAYMHMSIDEKQNLQRNLQELKTTVNPDLANDLEMCLKAIETVNERSTQQKIAPQEEKKVLSSSVKQEVSKAKTSFPLQHESNPKRKLEQTEEEILEEMKFRMEPDLVQATDFPTADQIDIAKQGIELMQKGRFGKAIETFSQFLKERPNDSTVMRARAEAYIQAREYDKALGDLNHIILKTDDEEQKLSALRARGTLYNARAEEKCNALIANTTEQKNENEYIEKKLEEEFQSKKANAERELEALKEEHNKLDEEYQFKDLEIENLFKKLNGQNMQEQNQLLAEKTKELAALSKELDLNFEEIKGMDDKIKTIDLKSQEMKAQLEGKRLENLKKEYERLNSDIITDLKNAKKQWNKILDEYPKDSFALSHRGWTFFQLGTIQKEDSLLNQANNDFEASQPNNYLRVRKAEILREKLQNEPDDIEKIKNLSNVIDEFDAALKDNPNDIFALRHRSMAHEQLSALYENVQPKLSALKELHSKNEKFKNLKEVAKRLKIKLFTAYAIEEKLQVMNDQKKLGQLGR